MTKQQAMALLRLLADLYAIAEAPDPEPVPEVVANGKQAKEPAGAAQR
jgi:hypothetical protein